VGASCAASGIAMANPSGINELMKIRIGSTGEYVYGRRYDKALVLANPTPPR
jgi:hypothetical protein